MSKGSSTDKDACTPLGEDEHSTVARAKSEFCLGQAEKGTSGGFSKTVSSSWEERGRPSSWEAVVNTVRGEEG